MPAVNGMRAAAALLFAGAALGSCYNPTFVSGVTKCSASGACPNDWACESGVCVDVSSSGSGGSPATGGQGGSPSTGGNGGGGTGGSTASGGHGGTGAGGSTASGGHGGTGAGGSTASGGHGGTGAGGTGGATGSGGATTGTGGSQATCLQGATMRPSGALITDFSDAIPDTSRAAGDFSFGTSAGQLGGTGRYASGTLGTSTLSAGQLIYTATVEAPTASDMYPFSGQVVFFDGPACTDATGYTGVQFALSLSGTCQVVFMFTDTEHITPAADPLRGNCSATTCYANQMLVSSGTNKVPFNATPFVAGQPTATVDPTKLIGVQWQFGLQTGSTTGCSGSITLDNISFY